MTSVPVVNGNQPVAADLQCTPDPLALVVRHGDDPAAFRQNTRDDEAPVIPPHVLIPRRTGTGTFLQENNIVQGKHQRNVAPQRRRIAGTMQDVGPDPAHRFRQADLFPKRIERSVYRHDMHILALLEAAVFARVDEDEIFVFTIYLLQFPDHFQRDEIHPMLIHAENALGFDSYFHGIVPINSHSVPLQIRLQLSAGRSASWRYRVVPRPSKTPKRPESSAGRKPEHA